MNWSNVQSPHAPHADVCETADAIWIDFEVPGVAESDLSLRFEPGQIVISGTRQRREVDGACRCHVVEIETGAFRRAVPIPTEVDGSAVEATLENGVLRVRVPKAKPKNETRRISIL
jgi:HSP20 family protein